MQANVFTAPRPVLNGATRSFVRRALGAGLVEINDLKKVVVSLMAESERFTPRRLADGLVGAGILTQWQANKLLAGKSKGFYLGSYRLLRPLGKGGMGVVYLGEHHVMKRLMALKILPPEAAKNQRRIDRFKEEARVSAQLDHPNIVRAYDFAEASGKLYIVMEYVDGIDLHHAVRRDGVMSLRDALDVLTQATRGLVHAHQRGIIHRDIKPSNLMLRSDGMVKVSDLGLARIGLSVGSGEGEQKRLMGTTDFIAPEQAIDSKTADARADIYSLGCTLFFLLTGRSPFQGTSYERLAKHQTMPVPDIREFRSDCTAAIAELAMRTMAKRPEDRPRSAAELLTQLTRLGGGSDKTSRQHLRHVAPAGDTTVDDSLYQATIDDTSLSADSEITVAVEVIEDDAFDFSILPPVDAETIPSPVSKPVATPPKRPNNSGNREPSKRDKSAHTANEQLLLGVGLTLAVVALLFVFGLGIYMVMWPAEQPPARIKMVEDGNRTSVVILNE